MSTHQSGLTVAARRDNLQRLAAANQMTPVGLEVLIAHYYRSACVELSSDAQMAAAIYLRRHGLLTTEDEQRFPDLHSITDKGRAHVDALVSLPFPVARTIWETPARKESQQ